MQFRATVAYKNKWNMITRNVRDWRAVGGEGEKKEAWYLQKSKLSERERKFHMS